LKKLKNAKNPRKLPYFREFPQMAREPLRGFKFAFGNPKCRFLGYYDPNNGIFSRGLLVFLLPPDMKPLKNPPKERSKKALGEKRAKWLVTLYNTKNYVRARLKSAK